MVAEISLEDFWCANTVYPSVLLLRVSYRGYPVVQGASLRLNEECVLYGLEFAGVEEETGRMRFGATVQKSVRLRERRDAGGEFNLNVRVSNVSVFLDLNPGVSSAGIATVLPAFVEGAPILSQSEELPVVAYVGSGALAAAWPKDGAVHLVIFERPGNLAEMRFNVLDTISQTVIDDGSVGCRWIYTRLPFSVKPPAPSYGEDVRPSYRRAFNCILKHYSAADDDFHVMRGDPGIFAVIYRRVGERLIVCGITNASRTLTVRFEDIWQMLPDEMKTLTWRAYILRDPVLDEPGDVVEESFSDLAPDTRIALDLKKNGGFVIEFLSEKR